MTCTLACTDDDVVHALNNAYQIHQDVLTGVAQLSVQLHNLSAYTVVVTGIALFFLVACAVLLFVNAR